MKKYCVLMFLFVSFISGSHAAQTDSGATPEEVLSQQLIRLSSAKHWDGNADSLSSGTVLNILTNEIDWTTGYTTFYLGTRKVGTNQNSFLSGLSAHVEQCKTLFAPEGMDGYLVIATADFEIAYQHWPSEQSSLDAFSKYGATITSAVGEFMTYKTFKASHL